MPPQRRKGSIGSVLKGTIGEVPPGVVGWASAGAVAPGSVAVVPPVATKGAVATSGVGVVANPLADTAEHTPPVSPLRDARWPARAPARPDVLTMPLPEQGGEGPLSAEERGRLDACESSIDSLRIAFWAAGRALQIVRDGRLYRDAHSTFDDYVEQRWDMQRSYAHKLIRAWPLAARLHPVAPALNEGQVRELLPVAAEYGEDAAVAVYTTLAEDPTGKVTAVRLREAVAALPPGCDADEARRRVLAWLRGELPEQQRSADLFSTVETRLAALSRRVVRGSGADPVAAREFAARLRVLAQQIEEQLTV